MSGANFLEKLLNGVGWSGKLGDVASTLTCASVFWDR
jgi:hypothetical protein